MAVVQLSADVWETPDGDAYVIEIPVPGVRPDEITIEAMVGSLSVSTLPREAVADPGRKYVQREHAPQPMSRVFEFPVELETEGVSASLEYGMLNIHAPIAIEGRRRLIPIASAKA